MRISAGTKENDVPKISREEQRDLLALVNYTPEMKVPQLLRFIDPLLSKLRLSAYQDIFDWVLFNASEDILGPLFKANSPAVDLLFNFIQRGYRSTLGEKVNPRVAAFLFKLQLRLILAGFQAGDARILERFAQWKKDWNELLNVAFERDSGLAKLISETAITNLSSIENYPEITQDREFLELLVTSVLGECYRPTILSSNPDGLPLAYGNASFRKLLIDFGEKGAKEIVNEAAKRVLKTEAKEMQLYPGKFRVVTEDGEFLLNQRLFITSSNNLVALPQEVRSNPQYQTLFGKRGFLANIVQTPSGANYRITYKGECFSILHNIADGEIRIQKNINGETYQFFTGSLNTYLHCANEVLSKALAVKTRYWTKLSTGEVYIHNEKNGKLLMIATDQGIVRLLDDRRLILGQLDKRHKLTQTLERLEDPGHILPLISPDTGRLARLELCRLGINFTVEETADGHINYWCDKHPGFKIASQQNVRALKGFSTYLVVENAQGFRKVLVPAGPMDEQEITSFREQTWRAQLDRSPLNQKLVELNMAPGSDAIEQPKKLLETLYLAYIYLKTGQYREAHQLIDESHLFYRQCIGADEKQLFHWMIFGSFPKMLTHQIDWHPNAIAIRLSLFHWRAEDPTFEYTDEQHKQIDQDFKKYSNLENNVSMLMRNKSYNSNAQTTRVLKPFARTITLDFASKDTKWLTEDMRRKIVDAYRLEQHPPLRALIRPGETFIENFLLYYAIARADASQSNVAQLQQELKEILVACATDKAEPVAQFHRILIAVMCSPNKNFPGIKEMSQLLALPDADFQSEFAKKVIDPAEKYVKDQVMNLNLFVNASPPGIGGVNDSSKKSKLDRIIKIPEAPTTKTPNISLPNIPIEAIPDVGSLLDSAVLRKVVRNREED